MNEEGDPSLLDDIFDSEKDSSDEEESVPDMLLRAMDTSLSTDKWIMDSKSGNQFKYNSKVKKLICKTKRNQQLLEYIGNGRYIEFVEDRLDHNGETGVAHNEPQNGNELHLVCFDKGELEFVDASSGSTLGELIEVGEEKLKGFSIFLQKHDFDESTIRYLCKFDIQVIEYIIPRFAPTKSKAKNAIQKYLESLLRYPQKWRLKFGETAQTRTVFGFSIISKFGDSFLIRDESLGSHQYCLVDGIRWSDMNEPMSVVNGTIITIMNEKEKTHVPDFMFIVIE